ncbi:hypothetical protein BJ912DRAFT_962280, partial [Pholiota molesta]
MTSTQVPVALGTDSRGADGTFPAAASGSLAEVAWCISNEACGFATPASGSGGWNIKFTANGVCIMRPRRDGRRHEAGTGALTPIIMACGRRKVRMIALLCWLLGSSSTVIIIIIITTVITVVIIICARMPWRVRRTSSRGTGRRLVRRYSEWLEARRHRRN